jgi:hypothetical protein
MVRTPAGGGPAEPSLLYSAIFYNNTIIYNIIIIQYMIYHTIIP